VLHAAGLFIAQHAAHVPPGTTPLDHMLPNAPDYKKKHMIRHDFKKTEKIIKIYQSEFLSIRPKKKKI